MFKNAVAFRFSKPLLLSALSVAEKLEHYRYNPPLPIQAYSCGFEPPLGDDVEGASFVHEVDGRMLVALRRAVKTIKPAEIRYRIEQKVKEIEDSEKRTVYRKERESIKDDVIVALLPDAFPEEHRVLAFITPRTGLIVIDAGSLKAAEEFTSMLRMALEGLPVQSIVCANDLSMVMGLWLRDLEKLPEILAIGNSVDLSEKTGGGRVKFIKEDPQGEQAVSLVAARYSVSALSLSVNDGLPGFCFTFASDFVFNSIKTDEAFDKEKDADFEGDDFAKFKAAQLDVSLVLFAGVFDRVFSGLVESFGGFEQGQEPVTWVQPSSLLESLAAPLKDWKLRSVGE